MVKNLFLFAIKKAKLMLLYIDVYLIDLNKNHIELLKIKYHHNN